MKVFICLGLLVVAVSAVRDVEWDSFKGKFGKTYKSVAEEASRKQIFKNNLSKIAEHNEQYKQGKVTFTLGVNQFADLTTKEFAAKMNGYHANLKSKKAEKLYVGVPPTGFKVPASVDWREKGCVTSVKDQGQCGSCWAFSAAGALECQNFANTGNLISLSEQNLIDCTISYGNLGCNGGSVDNAFQYCIDNGGIDTEASYPYEERLGKCRYNVLNRGCTCCTYRDVPSGDEDALQIATANIGTISVTVDASKASFQLYSNGVYYEALCSQTNLDHSMLVVGYGSEGLQDYWIVKNSWGLSWGEQGYIKMSRNRNNNCGIATLAIFPDCDNKIDSLQ